MRATPPQPTAVLAHGPFLPVRCPRRERLAMLPRVAAVLTHWKTLRIFQAVTRSVCSRAVRGAQRREFEAVKPPRTAVRTVCETEGLALLATTSHAVADRCERMWGSIDRAFRWRKPFVHMSTSMYNNGD